VLHCIHSIERRVSFRDPPLTGEVRRLRLAENRCGEGASLRIVTRLRPLDFCRFPFADCAPLVCAFEAPAVSEVVNRLIVPILRQDLAKVRGDIDDLVALGVARQDLTDPTVAASASSTTRTTSSDVNVLRSTSGIRAI
jgi:hypothetical protein